MDNKLNHILIIDDDQMLIDSICHHAQMNTNRSLSRYEIIGITSKSDLDSFIQKGGGDYVHVAFIDMMMSDDPSAGVSIADEFEKRKKYFAFLSAQKPQEIENSLNKKYKYLLQVIRKREIKSLMVQMGSLAETTYKLMRKDRLLEKQKRKGMVIGALMLLCNIERKEAEKLAHKLAMKVKDEQKRGDESVNEYGVVFNQLMKSDLKSIRRLYLDHNDEHPLY